MMLTDLLFFFKPEMSQADDEGILEYIARLEEHYQGQVLTDAHNYDLLRNMLHIRYLYQLTIFFFLIGNARVPPCWPGIGAL